MDGKKQIFKFLYFILLVNFFYCPYCNTKNNVCNEACEKCGKKNPILVKKFILNLLIAFNGFRRNIIVKSMDRRH